MSQTRLGSLVETIVSIFVGFWLSVAVQIVIFPMLGLTISLQTNMKIVAILTVSSTIRSYALRRVFNWWHVRSTRCRNTA